MEPKYFEIISTQIIPIKTLGKNSNFNIHSFLNHNKFDFDKKYYFNFSYIFLFTFSRLFWKVLGTFFFDLSTINLSSFLCSIENWKNIATGENIYRFLKDMIYILYFMSINNKL